MQKLEITTTHLTKTIQGVIAEITITDDPSLDAAGEWIQFRVPVKCGGWWGLSAIQKAALQRIRDVIGDEIQRTIRIENQRPG